MATITLYRAADSSTLPGDCASFARDRDVAEAYLSNPGFGGATLWAATVEVEESEVLDLSAMAESAALELLAERTGEEMMSGIGVDEIVPRDVRLQEALREQGILWVVVRESYPADAETWIYIGGWEREPELEKAD